MNKILYIGNSDTAESLYKEYEGKDVELQPFYAEQSSKEDILNVIYDESEDFKGVIINVDEIGDTYKDLADIVENVLESSDIRLCLLCLGRMKDDDLIVAMLELGIQYIMLYPSIYHNAKVIDNILEGKTNVAQLLYNQPIDKTKKEVSNADNSSSDDTENSIEPKTIALGGCVPRMGTTTLSIQLIKYLQSLENNVCYVDSTGTNYMNDFLLVYEEEGEYDKEHNKFILDGIDFYYEFNNDMWEYITAQNYNYIVFDMGVISVDDDKICNFINTDYHILLAGSKANEFKAMAILLEKLYHSKTHFAFYSVPKAQIPSISGACTQNGQKHCFIPYIDDEFVLQENMRTIFNDIFD